MPQLRPSPLGPTPPPQTESKKHVVIYSNTLVVGHVDCPQPAASRGVHASCHMQYACHVCTRARCGQCGQSFFRWSDSCKVCTWPKRRGQFVDNVDNVDARFKSLAPYRGTLYILFHSKVIPYIILIVHIVHKLEKCLFHAASRVDNLGARR